MNKKGQTPEDGIFLLAFLLFLGIGALISTFVYNDLYTGLTAIPALNNSADVRAALEVGNTVNASWDYLILMVFLALVIGMIIIGYFIPAQPIFMVIYIIGVLFGGVMAAIVQYVWENISQTVQFTVITSSQLQIANHLLTNLVLYYVIAAMLAMVATYAKTQRQGEGLG